MICTSKAILWANPLEIGMKDEDRAEPRLRGGDATDRVVRALALESPCLHDRDSFLKCDAIREEFGDQLGAKIPSIKKAISRLAYGPRKGVKEVLWLCGNDPRVDLPAAGLIAVSVDIGTLREEEWIRAERTRALAEGRPAPPALGPELPPHREPTQESLMDEIVARSHEWIRDHIQRGTLPIAITNINIVHGSDVFDIVVNVSLATPDDLLRYTRDVIQRIPHVRGTHSMLLSSGYGFSNPA
jgi:hypothetical protein